MNLSEDDQNLIQNLPDRQLKLTTSRSEPNSNQITDNYHDLESGQQVLRSNSFSAVEKTKSKQITNNILDNILNILPILAPNLSRQSSVPIFYCTICLENHPVSNCFACSNCNFPHKYCRESIKSFAETLINDGNIKIRCPGFGECEGFLSDQELQELFCDNESLWKKFQRFREIKENPNFRECPFCNHSYIGDESHPEITCENCHQIYCFFHSNAHPNIKCHQYTKEQLKTQMKSYLYIKSTTRNCPSCSTPTEKNGGCNHMTCQHCHAVSLTSSILSSDIFISRSGAGYVEVS